MAVNLFIASGNLGKDIDIRTTPNDKIVGNFSLPVKQGFGDYEKTSWITCKLLGERARKLEPYLVKGKEVTVMGQFVLEEWEKNGEKHSMAVVIVDKLKLHGGKPAGEPAQNQEQAAVMRMAEEKSDPFIEETVNLSKPEQAAAPASFDNFDDDVPF